MSVFLLQAVPTPPPAMPSTLAYWPFATAAGLVVLLGLAHSILGERYILMRLFRREEGLPALFGGTRFTRDTLRFVWHLLTLALWSLAGVLWLIGQGGGLTRQERPVAMLMAGSFAAFALVTLALSRGRHLSWLVHLAVVLLIVIGMID